MLWGVQQLVNTDAHPGFNTLSDGINAALNRVEVVEQVGGLAKQIATRLGQLNASGATRKQHHIEPHLHAFNGVANSRCG